jgi:hypothetical protein
MTEEIIELAKSSKYCKANIHTFGIGEDCDTNLVNQVANAGNGKCSLILDNSQLRA